MSSSTSSNPQNSKHTRAGTSSGIRRVETDADYNRLTKDDPDLAQRSFCLVPHFDALLTFNKHDWLTLKQAQRFHSSVWAFRYGNGSRQKGWTVSQNAFLEPLKDNSYDFEKTTLSVADLKTAYAEPTDEARTAKLMSLMADALARGLEKNLPQLERLGLTAYVANRMASSEPCNVPDLRDDALSVWLGGL